jgi:vancomycin resistance protein YoaR
LMSTYTAVRHKMSPSPLTLLQVLAALVGGVALFFLFVVIFVIGFDLYYAGQVYPGISVAGIDLSGLEPGEAANTLAQNIPYTQHGKIVFQDGEDIWVATPGALGLMLDAENSALAAYRWGRHGNLLTRLSAQLGAWYNGKNIAPLFIYDERTAQNYLRQIAAQVDRPTIEASLSISGLDVVAIPGQIGRQLDLQASLAPLERQMRSLTDGLLPLVVHETPPGVLDASQQAEEARQILSAPLVLQTPDQDQGWTIEPERLADMLSIERVELPEGAQYQVGLNPEALTTYLSALAPELARDPRNTRFMFNDDTGLLEIIEPAIIGRMMDVDSTIHEINTALAEGRHTVPVTVQTISPEITDDMTGEQLGITELVTSYTSYFRGSITERLQNIETAAANFHGLLVAPGAVFSMADVMGDVSLDTGYAEAWIIYGGRTIKGVGGGVCQVSTTLFRTAFFAGFPINERHPHAYRVGYYEQTYNGHDASLAGLDATVFVPVVDFKFTNDTPYWLLMETYFNPTSRSLTWKFYSTSDGRTVEWDTTGPQNVVEPPEPLYEENPELAKGEIRQVDWAAEGADVTVNRTVYRDGQVLFTDAFTTHYLPWQDVYQYGPGTDLPGDEETQFFTP